MPNSLILDFFKPATPEEQAEQSKRDAELAKRTVRSIKAAKKVQVETQAQRLAEANAKRQREWRARQMEKEVEVGLRNPHTFKKIKQAKMFHPNTARPQIDHNTIKLESDDDDEPADDEKPNTTGGTKSLKRGRKDPASSVLGSLKTVRVRSKRIDWFHPARFRKIDAAAKREGFKNPQNIISALQKSLGGQEYKTLNRGTLFRWLDLNNRCWKPEILERAKLAANFDSLPVSKRKSLASGGGCYNILAKHQALEGHIQGSLKAMRTTGVPVNALTARATILGFIQQYAPEIISNPRFKCSNQFVRNFLSSKMGWSYRSATQASHKLPANWETLCVKMAMRVAWIIKHHNVPPSLVLNADQTGVVYLTTGSKTWDPVGTSQVKVSGKDEKRQFTLMPTVTSCGKMLPYQAIYSGGSQRSLPSAKSRAPGEAEGFLFSWGGTKHWSNLECMQDFVDKIIVPYVKQEQQRLELHPTQITILIIDCWSVHRSKDFLDWMKEKHRYIRIVFIPAGCTGVAQPCDVGIQRVLKHIIKTECVEYLTQQTRQQIQTGVAAELVQIDDSLPILRNASAKWVLASYNWFQVNPEAVKMAWRKCAFREWNLSYDFLTTDFAICSADEEYADSDEFAVSVARHHTPLADDDVETDPDGTDHEDDTALATEQLVQMLDVQAETADPTLTIQLLPEMAIREGNFEYVGEDELTDDDADSEPDPEAVLGSRFTNYRDAGDGWTSSASSDAGGGCTAKSSEVEEIQSIHEIDSSDDSD